MKVKEYIKLAKSKLQRAGIENKNEIYILIQELLGISRADLITLDTFSRMQVLKLNKAINKRIKGKSLQLIIGKSYFLGVEIKETKNTLTPRLETEYMTSMVSREKRGKVLDLCAGSGAIGLALAKSGFEVTLADISKKAIKDMRYNAKNNSLNVEIIKSDMFDSISGTFDIIVSNPPYIESQECKKLNKDVLNNDPIIALDGGTDGLVFYRIIANQAHEFLDEDGILYLEIGFNQYKSVAKLLENHFKNITIIKDMAGINRIIRAEKKC